MSCLGFLSPEQRKALRMSSNDGAPLSSFASPPATQTKVDRVRTLARSTDPRIRESAALAHHAPDDVLTALGHDPVEFVRRGVARNARASSEVLHGLAADRSPVVRAWVAANPATPPDVHLVLSRDADPTVQAVLEWAAGWA